MSKKQLIGTIVSTKNLKTVVVRVESIKEHPIYKRRFKIHKRYKAHNEKGDFQIGERVLIEECRPLSRDKRWIVLEKINQDNQ